MKLSKMFKLRKNSRTEALLDSKDVFYDKIKDYYLNSVSYTNQDNILNQLSDFLSTEFYEQYKKFRIQYPKSVKRYSTLKLSDLENPLTHDIIIRFIKNNYPTDYRDICAQLFKISATEFIEYEKKRTDFYNMF